MMRKIISLIGIITILAVGMTVAAGCGGSESAGKTVERLTVEKNTILVAESADDITLTVRIKYAGEDERAATSEDVEYSSDNTQVATVSKDGVVTVTGVGSAKLTVKSKSGGTTGEKETHGKEQKRRNDRRKANGNDRYDGRARLVRGRKPYGDGRNGADRDIQGRQNLAA